MSHHAEDHLRSLLGQVEGVSDDKMDADLAAYRRELLTRFTNEVTDRYAALKRAWEDDDGKMDPRARPLYHLMVEELLETQDDFTGRT